MPSPVYPTPCYTCWELPGNCKCVKPCRQCRKPRPVGYATTCGRSACQEAETKDNALRAKARKRRSK